MEPVTATEAAAAAAAASDVVTILGLMLNTDQFIAATHAAISVVQTLVVIYGIRAMVNTSTVRSADYDKRHRQIMDDQQKRHDEAMEAWKAIARDQNKRHDEAMADQKQRHDEAMASHRESMEALKELIRRTAPQTAES